MTLPELEAIQLASQRYGGVAPLPQHSRMEELLLREVWAMLRRRRYLILACTVACVLLAGFYILLKTPRYQASARIELSPAGTNSLGLDQLASKSLTPSDSAVQLQSAVSVLQSRTIALNVMKQLRMAERKDFAGSWLQPVDTEFADLSPEARDNLLERFHQSLNVEVVPKTDIISVEFRATDPKLAADAVNETVSSYTERSFHTSYDAVTQVSQWLSGQMDDLKARAKESQEKLAALQKQRGLIGVDENDNIVTDRLKGLDEQLTAAESDRIVKEARYRIAVSGNPELIASAVPDSTLQVLRAQQAQLQVDHARLSTKFGEGYPKLAELGSQMAQVDAAIAGELKNLSARYKNDYGAALRTEQMLRGNFEEQKQKAYKLTEGAAQYAILKREVEANQDLYQTLQLKLRQAGIVAGLSSANVAVVEPGQVPSKPFDPRPWFDLTLALGAGLVLGLLSAVGLEALDRTVRSSQEVESITGLPALAVIPQIGPAERVLKLHRAPLQRRLDEPLVACKYPHSAAAESYRGLRTSLLLGSPARATQVLAITSSRPEEGKTLTAVNCALVLAQQGAKVLLVDADLRQPGIHQAFGISQDPGLSTILSDVCAEQVALARAESLSTLTVLPAGPCPESPAEMLSSSKMLELMEHWRSQYDYIVMDTPPISMFTDAVVLGAHADAVLLIARASVTTSNDLRQAYGLLQRAQANIAGVVLNGVDGQHKSGCYDSYSSSGPKKGAHPVDTRHSSSLSIL